MKKEFKIDIKRNKSTTYMFPLVAAQVPFKYENFILNTYISFEDGDEIFCVLYQWSGDPDFLKYEGELMENHLYVGHCDYGNKVVYKFRLTLAVQRERRRFVTGQYKYFEESSKDLIFKYLSSKRAKNTVRIVEILSRDGKLTSDPPDMEKETLSNHVKELVLNIETFRD